MKLFKVILLSMAIALISINIGLSQNGKLTTTKFKVYGNCEMCKKRIEKSVKGMNGIESGVWDADTKVFTLKSDTTKISTNNVEEKIAQAGYDTEHLKADNKAYNNLPGCCQYERK